MEANKAAALSQATIVGGSVINFIYNIQLKHPYRPHRPLINFAIMLIFEPLLLVGTTVGVIFNIMFPPTLILFTLISVLAFAVYRTSRKGIRIWNKEKCRRIFQPSSHSNSGISDDDQSSVKYDISQPLKHSSGPSQPSSYGSVNKSQVEQQSTAKSYQSLKPFLEYESRIVIPVIILCIVWLLFSLAAFLRMQSITGVTDCGAIYWLITFGIFPFMIAISLFTARKEMKLYSKKISLGWLPAEGDVIWNLHNSLLYPMIAAIAGMLGGLLGLLYS